MVAQVALSLVLLIVAGLFVHSFAKVTRVELGFDRDHLLLFGSTPSLGLQGTRNHPVLQGSDGPDWSASRRSSRQLFAQWPLQRVESGDQISIEAYTPKSGQEMGARFDHVGPIISRPFESVLAASRNGRRTKAEASAWA